MDTIDKALDRIYCEIDDIISHPTLDKQDVEFLGEFIDMVKDSAEMDYYYSNSMNDDGYSNMGGNSYMRGRSSRMMPMYNRGFSYSRGYDKNGYSRTDNKEAMLDHLQDVMDMAVDEKDRKAVERLMQQMSER